MIINCIFLLEILGFNDEGGWEGCKYILHFGPLT